MGPQKGTQQPKGEKLEDSISAAHLMINSKKTRHAVAGKKGGVNERYLGKKVLASGIGGKGGKNVKH